MTYKQAISALHRAEKNGYVRYHSGLTHENETGHYGINIDGDGHDGRLFGCPQIIWDKEQAEEKFPKRKYSKKY